MAEREDDRSWLSGLSAAEQEEWDALLGALETLRNRVRAEVDERGPDGCQVAVDRLVWSHAHAEAARATSEWAAASGNPLVHELAEIAREEAAGFVLGREAWAATLQRGRLAEVGGRLDSLVDAGAGEEQRLLRATIREFAEKEIAPHAETVHRGDLDVPEHIVSGVAALGLLGLSVPAAYGGAQEESDFQAMLIATEELSRASLAAGGSLMTRPEILVRALLKGGTPFQKERWLPPIASGEKMVAVAVTEPDHGSDVAALACRAAPVADGWELTGTKLWCTFAGRAELLMILCRTGGDGHRGLSVFVVEKPAFSGHEFELRQITGGSLRGRSIPTIGYRGMHTFELAFDRLRVPRWSLVGEEQWLDRGFYLQLEAFSVGRIQTAGRAVGLMHAALERAVAYAAQRVAFGKPIVGHQLVRAKLGEMALRTYASQQLGYRAARLLDRGLGQVEASLAKLYASRMAEYVTREAMQVHGAMGYAEETDVSRYFVDARVLAIFEGAEDVLSLRVIAPALLGRRA